MMRKGVKELEGYELLQVAGVERNFLDKLVPILAFIASPMQEKKKMRIVIDYDPQKDKTEFRYYSPEDRPGESGVREMEETRKRLEALEKRVLALELFHPAYTPKDCTREEYEAIRQKAFEEVLALREHQ